MATKKKANNLKDQSQWEYKEEIVATYHFELPKETALMTAASKGRLKMVKFLLLFQMLFSVHFSLAVTFTRLYTL
ncbi:MAG: hypothetical protein AAGU75_11670 [Bacillota bacterium]